MDPPLAVRPLEKDTWRLEHQQFTGALIHDAVDASRHSIATATTEQHVRAELQTTIPERAFRVDSTDRLDFTRTH